MKKFAVLGNPIAQSMSPFIHQLFAKQSNELLQYDALLIPKTSFSEYATNLFENEEFKGANVTVPFKQEAAKFASVLTEEARIAGSVNTLIKLDNRVVVGANTDGVGLVNDLVLNNVGLSGQRVLLIGAGGAARGVISPLIQAGVASIAIVNRTYDRAISLINHFKHKQLEALSLDQLNQDGHHFDLVINSTSASLYGELPGVANTVLAHAACCYDMAYASEPTIFVAQCEQLGVKQCIDGLGMLVGQAAESYFLWNGVRPDVKPVLAALRQRL
ncbi:shikimate dehydrogenase [Aestuariibacter salexigens]|uniref:shikimate dehydrogenase n=1 Tax=Aestuariibacter salexigens TaxID=226010 RepID=UPI00040E1893|nr:shikimate dehydrogenase [Aestuariibacter salexigens]